MGGRGASSTSGRGISGDGLSFDIGVKADIPVEKFPAGIVERGDLPRDVEEIFNEWTTSSYDLFRHVDEIKSETKRAEYQRRLDVMESYLENSLVQRNQIHRGVALSNDVVEGFVPGAIIDQKGISSWSNYISEVERFASYNTSIDKPNKVVFHMNGGTKMGLDIHKISQYEGEGEVTVSRHSKQRVISTSKVGGILHVIVEEV